MIETLTKFRYEVCGLLCSSIAAFGADIESCTDVIRIGGQNQCIGTVDYLRLTLNYLIELLLVLDLGRHFRAIAAEGSEMVNYDLSGASTVFRTLSTSLCPKFHMRV